ncbi:hypothetical protein NDU88_005190 [Pleurodeles waltl]|uniref:Secreted protein n=1 Tax=Pleurodeles waltl TaxID=8319 RepID=A0AAV7LKG6_PLEWA|nr:hypothetical protein NDU88_005190 [Pleurodeles waltl]
MVGNEARRLTRLLITPRISLTLTVASLSQPTKDWVLDLKCLRCGIASRNTLKKTTKSLLTSVKVGKKDCKNARSQCTYYSLVVVTTADLRSS